jgi:hypothetical protein
MVQLDVVCGIVLSLCFLVAFDRLVTLSLFANCLVIVVTCPHCSYTMLSTSCSVDVIYLSLNEIKAVHLAGVNQRFSL